MDEFELLPFTLDRWVSTYAGPAEGWTVRCSSPSIDDADAGKGYSVHYHDDLKELDSERQIVDSILRAMMMWLQHEIRERLFLDGAQPWPAHPKDQPLNLPGQLWWLLHDAGLFSLPTIVVTEEQMAKAFPPELELGAFAPMPAEANP